MKKFNSIFAIATVVLATVFGLSSCEKEAYNELPVPQTVRNTAEEPKEQATVTYEYFVGNSTLSLGDVVITVEYNGEKTQHSVSAGESTRKAYMVTAEDGMDEKLDVRGKHVVIKDVKVGSVVTPSFIPNEEAFAALPADGTTDVVLTGMVNSATRFVSAEGYTNTNLSKFGMPNSQVKDYIFSSFASASQRIYKSM